MATVATATSGAAMGRLQHHHLVPLLGGQLLSHGQSRARALDLELGPQLPDLLGQLDHRRFFRLVGEHLTFQLVMQTQELFAYRNGLLLIVLPEGHDGLFLFRCQIEAVGQGLEARAECASGELGVVIAGGLLRSLGQGGGSARQPQHERHGRKNDRHSPELAWILRRHDNDSWFVGSCRALSVAGSARRGAHCLAAFALSS